MERISIYKVKYTSQIVDYTSKEFDKYSAKIKNLFRVREPSKNFDFSILGECKLLILKNEVSNMIYGLIMVIFPQDRKWLKYIFKREGYKKLKNYSRLKLFKNMNYYIYKKKIYYVI